LLFENERIVGVRATPRGELEVRADLVVGADGRSSTVRERADLEAMDLGVPIDVLWFGLSQQACDPERSTSNGCSRGRSKPWGVSTSWLTTPVCTNC
jgi:2-polyprenyl-6-methoxyphenol hydroxylase-like FAD-dependent oxidoreductase